MRGAQPAQLSIKKSGVLVTLTSALASFGATIFDTLSGEAIKRSPDLIGALVKIGLFFIAYTVLDKKVSGEARSMVPALAMLALDAILVGVILLFVPGLLAIQLAVVLIGIVWLVKRPGTPSVIFVAAYELAMVFSNIADIGTQGISASLITMMFLRILTVGFLWHGLKVHKHLGSQERVRSATAH
jgi:hypothetical protein